MTLLVEIWYREPSYELRNGEKAEPYRWRFRVHASSEADAIRIALAEFRQIEAISSVGWARDVVDVAVTSIS